MCAEEDGLAAFAALFTEYLSYTEIRNDVVAVADFDIGDSDLLERAIKLFWEVAQPSLFSFSDKRYESKDVPPFPIELEHALLEKLAEFERRSRVDYLPDEDPFTRFPERMVYIHVAAARALRLKWTQGYTDETRQSLESAFMVAKQLDPEPPSVYGDEAPPQISSAWAATGLALKELFWVHNLNGQYPEALHDLALAIDYLGAALSSAEYFAEETHADTERGKHESYLAHDLIGRISPYVLIEDPETMRIKPLPRTRPPIFDVAPSEAVETFRSLRDSDNREVDWKQVARDCEILGRHWGVCLGYEDFVVNETVTDSEGAERVWSHLWALNQGWAEAELEPNDLRDYLRDERRERADEQAKKRLKTYFFTGDRWGTLPDLARKSLVDADREWFSIGRGRLESVLNDLRVASDTLCYDFLWEPVGRSKGGVGLLRFVEKCKELDIDRKEPGISEYIWLLGQPFFKEFASKADLTTQETAFLTIELKKALEDLRHQRNIAEHERKRDWKLHEVQDYLRKFMGIGCLGILPRLVDIGLKLKPGKPV